MWRMGALPLRLPIVKADHSGHGFERARVLRAFPHGVFAAEHVPSSVELRWRPRDRQAAVLV